MANDDSIKEKLVLQHPTPIMAQLKFDRKNPRHLCCHLHCEPISKVIAITEIVLSVIFFIVVIVCGTVCFDSPAVGLIIGGVTDVIFAIPVAALILVGIKKEISSWLIPYLLFKAFQMVAVGIFMVIFLLTLLGFSFISGLVAATSGEEYAPPDLDPWSSGLDNHVGPIPLNETVSLIHPEEGVPTVDEGAAAVNRITIIFSLLLVSCMVTLIAFIYCVIIVFKEYRYLKEKAAFDAAPKTPIAALYKSKSDPQTTGAKPPGTENRKVSSCSQTDLTAMEGENQPLKPKRDHGCDAESGCDCEPGSLCPRCRPPPYSDLNGSSSFR